MTNTFVRETHGSHSGAQLLRLRSVIRKTELSRSTIYRLMRDGQFPSSVRVGKATVAWVAADIDQWIDAKRSGAA